MKLSGLRLLLFDKTTQSPSSFKMVQITRFKTDYDRYIKPVVLIHVHVRSSLSNKFSSEFTDSVTHPHFQLKVKQILKIVSQF